jgi:hypothetical protein
VNKALISVIPKRNAIINPKITNNRNATFEIKLFDSENILLLVELDPDPDGVEPLLFKVNLLYKEFLSGLLLICILIIIYYFLKCNINDIRY